MIEQSHDPPLNGARRSNSAKSVRIKICGVTRPEDVRLCCALGADYLGFNFYKKSPRFVSADTAAALRAEMTKGTEAIGVFVNTPVNEIEEISRAVGLDLIQFHGDESPVDIGPMAHRSIRAIPVKEDFEIASLDQWRDCWGLLFDAPAGALYGGTGKSWSYEKVRAASGRIFLAGGLHPDNVAEAVDLLPDLFAVDVCSGVEASPGIKSRRLLTQFFEQVRGRQSSSNENGAHAPRVGEA